jgi:hypothetical protein
MNEDDPL